MLVTQDLLKRLNKTDNQRFPFQNYQWMLDIIKFIKQIFALWIFCCGLLVWLLIYLESQSLSFGDLFPGKQTPSWSEKLVLLLLISVHFSLNQPSAPTGPFSHDLCLSLQMRKEDCQRPQLRCSFHSICQVEISGKKNPGSRASFRRKLGSLFSVLLSWEKCEVCMMGWRMWLLTNTVECKCYGQDDTSCSVKAA